MHREASALFQRLGVHIDPRRPALGLSIADQQIIEIAKAISLDARLLVMDEPTAALSGNEVAGSSRSPAASATRAAPWSSSPTASTRSSPSATTSR